MKHNYKNLEIWKRSKQLTLLVYEITKAFPNEEKFGLTSQIRRAAVSIPSNIAEGCGRNSDKELIRFINIAVGSICELETQINISKDLGYLNGQTETTIINRILEVRKMMIGFSKSLSSRI